MFSLIKNLIKSFRFAVRGVSLCLKRERNFRIHTVAIFYVSVFAVLYKLETTKVIMLLLTFAVTLFAEMINTAVETLIDMITYSYSYYARDAKDVAAGAVMICAIVSVIIAIFMFSDIERVKGVIYIVFRSPYYLGAFFISLIPAVLFVKGRKND